MTDQSPGDGHVLFPGDHLLEGSLEWPEAESPAGGVVVAHPHSLHGGTMAQPIVYRVAKSCRERGLATLRFNFRGVGKSRGGFSGMDEYRDVEAAAAFLYGKMAAAMGDAVPGPETPPIGLAGYSFGSVMAANAVGDGATTGGVGTVPVKALALIAFLPDWPELPPDTYARLATFKGPVLAVAAEHDDFGYPDDVERTLKRLGLDFSLAVIEGTGHFMEGRHREVGEIVASFFSQNLG